MTLLLNAVVKQHVIHASDRLVSLAPGRQGQGGAVWDAAANKTVVVVASDGWLVISYAGLAYLDGKPTDQWIAEAITGQDLSMGGLIGWQRPPIFHVQSVGDLLRDSTEEAFRRLSPRLRAQPLEIHIAGLQRGSPRLAHVLWSVNNSRGDFVLHKTDLTAFRWDSGYSMLIGGSPQSAEIQALRARLRDEGEQSPEHFRDLLAECILRTSKSSSGTIGEDSMTVVLKPGSNRIETLYVPVGRGASDKPAPAYAPWGLLPGVIYAPALVSGRQEWEIAGITYVVSGPELSPGMLTYGSHRRRSEPGRGPGT